MKEARRRRDWWLAALAAAACVVLVLLAARWRELGTRYYLWRLEGDGSPRIDAAFFFPEPPNSLRWQALERFVRTGKGKEKLLRTFIAHADDATMVLRWQLDQLGSSGAGTVVSARGGPGPAPPPGLFLLVWVDEAAHYREVVKWPGGETADRGYVAGGVSGSGHLGLLPGPLARRLQELLLTAGLDRYPLPADLGSGLRVSVVSLDQADPRCARRFPGRLLGKAGHAVLFEREGWEIGLLHGELTGRPVPAH